MKPALALTAFPAALLAGCGAAQPSAVARYLEQCDALKGKLVSVAGYVEECSSYSCNLYSDRSGPDQWRRRASGMRAAAYRVRDGQPPDQAAIPAEPPMIGIAGSNAFNRKAQAFQNRYVVITGIVDKRNCSGTGGAGRLPGLHPTDIRAWTPSEGAPQNPK